MAASVYEIGAFMGRRCAAAINHVDLPDGPPVFARHQIGCDVRGALTLCQPVSGVHAQIGRTKACVATAHMSPRRGGIKAPLAKKWIAAAMPYIPVSGSRATMVSVMALVLCDRLGSVVAWIQRIAQPIAECGFSVLDWTA